MRQPRPVAAVSLMFPSGLSVAHTSKSANHGAMVQSTKELTEKVAGTKERAAGLLGVVRNCWVVAWRG